MPQNERNQKVFSVKVYDKKHLSNLNKRMKRVQQLLDAAVGRAVGIASKTGYEDLSEDFRFDDFPQARREIDALLGELSTSLTLNVESANSEAWGLSNRKNDAMADFMLEQTGVELPRKATRKWYNKNERALNAFKRRVSDGLNLSSNVWNLAQFKGELELSLEMELGRGKSAAEISRDVRSFLKYPNKLFRRVRDEKGVLRLSRAAREFHPGQGVYRSSYKNALRLTATETNMAYRTADNMRWNQMDFVLGQHIEPSKTNHPVVDICDELKGDYPKDFKFVGWHPFCKCFAVPKLASKEEFIKYQQAILDGEDVSDWKFDGEVKDVPGNFKDWVKENEERIANAKSQPYFLKDNPKYVTTPTTESSGFTKADLKEALKNGDEEIELSKIYGSYYDEIEGEVVNYFGQQHIDWSKAEEMVVSTENLCSVQEHVFPNILEKYVKNGTDGLVQIIDVDGVPFVFDGNHRAAAQIINGKKEMKALVYKLPKSHLNEMLMLYEEDNDKFMDILMGMEEYPFELPKYRGLTGAKFGRTATKVAKKMYEELPAPELSELVEENINEIARSMGVKEPVTPMKFLDANTGRGNIDYGKGIEFKDNCQISIVVHEARLRGLNITALGYEYDNKSVSFMLGERFQSAWIHPKTNKTPKPTELRGKTFGDMIRKLEQTTKSPGRYHIGINTNESGHLITAERFQDGKMLFYDAQNGEFLNIEEYANDSVSYFEVLKVDKLLLRKDIIKRISRLI